MKKKELQEYIKLHDKEYTLVQDGDCHRYIIPFDKMLEWNNFMEIPTNDESSWEVPDFANRIDGTLIFKEYRII